MRMYPNFENAITAVRNEMRLYAALVPPTFWQSTDVSGKPEMATYELRNADFTVNMTPWNLEQMRAHIGPNLPWADDHFLERVCGQPINPGEQWAKWPYGNSADKFRGMVRSMAQADWAYLAGIIDGEGSFSLRRANEDDIYPRIKITQVDEFFIRSLFDQFKVGTFRPYSNPSNKLSDKQSWIWRISAQAEVRWVVEGCLPYLKLKKDRALEALSHLPASQLWDPEPFNHNYMQRYWPRQAGGALTDHRGIYNRYGDLEDVLDLLVRDPLSRQAYVPIFFPEDTGTHHRGRIPCSLGYHLIRRNDKLHISYFMRSCDLLRHFQDDIYLTVRLCLWFIDQLKARDAATWGHVRPGDFFMTMTSLHLFRNDWQQVFNEKPPVLGACNEYYQRDRSGPTPDRQ